MAAVISLTQAVLEQLDLAPAEDAIAALLTEPTTEPELRFAIDYPRDPSDPRELSELPEVRLWFVRLDVTYPWLPLYLDWKGGELARYVAMLIPHQFHPTEGIQYNPEALEIWVMAKVFVLHRWLGDRSMQGNARLKAMTQVLGYEIDDAFFAML
ncbi:MAG: CRR6 family NdhI maturation factor [Synechococcales cyanobacterium RM1_1_8]|nr:CRR6 family NdhI maturation factor [Synechococcales cyanobacterium RM1_1_8]